MAEFQISLAAARVKANLTQEEAAAAIGVSKVTSNNWEHGQCLPNMKLARKISEVYGIPLDYIFLPDT